MSFIQGGQLCLNEIRDKLENPSDIFSNAPILDFCGQLCLLSFSYLHFCSHFLKLERKTNLSIEQGVYLFIAG